MKVRIREYNSQDRDKICSLLKRNTPYQRDQEFWVWINKCIGSELPIIVVAEINSTIIGHYAIIPHSVAIEGLIVKAGLGIHALIDPKFNSQVSIYDITALAYKIAKERGLHFIYGFPNDKYRLIQERIEKWKKVADFSAIEFSTSANDHLLEGVNSNYPLKRCSNSYQDLFLLDDVIFNKVKNSRNYIIKNLNYYKARYLEHPQNLYDCFFILKNQELVGFVVFKEFQGDTDKKGHLVDYVISPSLTEMELLKITFNYFRDKVEKVSLWPNNSSIKSSLDKIKGAKNGFNTFFAIKILDKEFCAPLVDMFNFKNWELVMGDSDAF